ncbi:MAG TPA: hypothetical protein VKI44_09225 [Acetobacteraceae bacterium]|nr:hypothetical protein [Acetobacteraceae bacterium]
MIFGAVEGDQNMPVEPAEHVEPARDPPQLCDRFSERRIKQRRRRRVQHVTNVIVARDLRYAEQTRAVGSPMALLELPLMSEERRALHEKHRKRRHTDVG